MQRYLAEIFILYYVGYQCPYPKSSGQISQILVYTLTACFHDGKSLCEKLFLRNMDGCTLVIY